MPRPSVSLFRRIERALETIAGGATAEETIQQTAQYLADHFSRALGIPGGRIYSLDELDYELVATFGRVAKAPIGLRVPRSYAAFDQLLDTGVRVMDRTDPLLDQRLEAELGTRDHFAAIAVANGRYVLSFDVRGQEVKHDELASTLNIIRLAINQKVREDRMLGILEESRQIQNSILPRRLPRVGDYLLAARTQPAEIVGGDFYDVITFGSDSHIFYLVVADATGHGLPAALQVRDIYTGLRMGLSRDFKVTRTLERLNRIIHRSRLATKFVTLFLAEVDLSGSVMYCNAGHPPALLVRARGSVKKLSTGGRLLGPLPDNSYSVGLERLEPGDVLVIYSDGITEVTDPVSNQELGEQRLIELVTELRHLEPEAIVERIFAVVAEHSSSQPPEDDRTVLVLKRRDPAQVEMMR
jgi:sigma-B regulation protein RsbU (phosphoserine phosphatase)